MMRFEVVCAKWYSLIRIYCPLMSTLFAVSTLCFIIRFIIVILSVSEVSKRWYALGLRGGGFVWVGVLFRLGWLGWLDTSGFALSMTE